MVIGIVKETQFKRVAIAPAAKSKLEKLGLNPWIESGAGVTAGFTDLMYEENQFNIASRSEILSSAEDVIFGLDKFDLNVVSMDMVPRTTLAQAMDVLSSMASLAGYKAVLKGADHYNNMFPMMMTAAGTIPPTKVMVLGAGVAGLQAIATAKRLGAVVEAFDTRAAAKEEVMSLGASFVEVEGAADDRGAGGYAVQQSEEYLQRQRALVQERALKSNIIIATAQVRGKKAPLLVTEETISNMKPGSVIVDLAASTGGNCAFTQNNATIVRNGVVIIGNSDLADELCGVASTLFSNNIINFLQMAVQNGSLNLSEENEIIRSALISKAH
ncbi:MAG: NAD(P) transhydrogenase subunit alpha [Saprospiraceae bacterium]|nr:NAD(P) transhydrogenase subunit alpha [Saprospiraceae bacterium]